MRKMPLWKGSRWADNSLQEDIYLKTSKEISEIALGCYDLIFSFIKLFPALIMLCLIFPAFPTPLI